MKTNPWNQQILIELEDVDKDIPDRVKQWHTNLIEERGSTRRMGNGAVVTNIPPGWTVPTAIQNDIHTLYYKYELGNPSMSRLLSIPKSRMRNIGEKSGLKRRDNSFTADRVKAFRSQRISGINNMQHYPDICNMDETRYNTGIGGYYHRKNDDKIFLRSCWEYIYAKWLDRNNIQWEYEVRQYKVVTTAGKWYGYRPDFFIYNKGSNELSHVVEVKGYNKSAQFKTLLLEKQHNIKVVLVDNINHYLTETNYHKELKTWKQLQEKKSKV